MICNHDCFQCPYPDCVANDGATPEEIEASYIRDARVNQTGDAEKRKTLKEARLSAYRAWYWRNREEVNRARRERYASDSAYREARRESVRKSAAKKRAQKQTEWIINPSPIKLEYKYALDYIRAHREKRANDNPH